MRSLFGRNRADLLPHDKKPGYDWHRRGIVEYAQFTLEVAAEVKT